MRRGARQLRGRGLAGSARDAYAAVRRRLFRVFLRLPGVRATVQRQLDATITRMEQRINPSDPSLPAHKSLPSEGLTDSQVLAELDRLAALPHARWEDGRVSGTVYHGGAALGRLQAQAYEKFGVANPIHPDVFPGVRRMEAEVVAMTAALFHAPAGAAGCMTSGGTESILLAVYGARQRARAERGVTAPEMVLPDTAHAAFLKAAAYFGIAVRTVPCPPPSYRVDVRAAARCVTANTVLLVGSAPNFPHGVTDDLAALSRLALRGRRGAPVPLHVDACLGSFVTPFLARAGLPSAPFDFALPGVTSLSCDVHKYAFGPKGGSVLLHRGAALRAWQYFVAADWPGGVYASAGLAGSRPGSLIAATWATLVHYGENGYREACAQIVGARARLQQAVREREGLAGDLLVVGEPQGSVVAFRSERLNVYEVADGMTARGWHLNALQAPPAVHVAVTLPMVPAIDQLVEDLVGVVVEVRDRAKEQGSANGKGKGPPGGDATALYGVAGSLPDKSVVVQLAEAYLDTLYKT